MLIQVGRKHQDIQSPPIFLKKNKSMVMDKELQDLISKYLTSSPQQSEANGSSSLITTMFHHQKSEEKNLINSYAEAVMKLNLLSSEKKSRQINDNSPVREFHHSSKSSAIKQDSAQQGQSDTTSSPYAQLSIKLDTLYETIQRQRMEQQVSTPEEKQQHRRINSEQFYENLQTISQERLQDEQKSPSIHFGNTDEFNQNKLPTDISINDQVQQLSLSSISIKNNNAETLTNLSQTNFFFEPFQIQDYQQTQLLEQKFLQTSDQEKVQIIDELQKVDQIEVEQVEEINDQDVLEIEFHLTKGFQDNQLSIIQEEDEFRLQESGQKPIIQQEQDEIDQNQILNEDYISKIHNLINDIDEKINRSLKTSPKSSRRLIQEESKTFDVSQTSKSPEVPEQTQLTKKQQQKIEEIIQKYQQYPPKILDNDQFQDFTDALGSPVTQEQTFEEEPQSTKKENQTHQRNPKIVIIRDLIVCLLIAIVLIKVIEIR